MEVLQQGPEEPGSRRRRRLRAGVIAAGATVAAALAILGVRGLMVPEQPTLTVLSVERVAATTVNPNAENSGWPGAPGIPADAVLPGAIVDVAVSGDDVRELTIRAAESSGALHLEPSLLRSAGRDAAGDQAARSPAGDTVELPRGSTTTIRMVMAPADCSAVLTERGLDEAGYRWRQADGVRLLQDADGRALPLTEAARDNVSALLQGICAPAGDAPRITVVGASLDGPPREQVLKVATTVSADADEVIVTPLDGSGLRGIGSFERLSRDQVTLMWRVAPLGEDTDGVLQPHTQAVTIVDGVAYPWVLILQPVSPIS